MKCPDCKTKVNPERNGDWACGECFATGVTLVRKPVVVTRHLTFSGVHKRIDEKGHTVIRSFRPWLLNPHHPNASVLTKLRARTS
jgi:hypothetical protein